MTTFKASALQFVSTEDFQTNLDTLCGLVEQSQSDLIVAPEVCLTNFSYDRFEQSAAFSLQSYPVLKRLSKGKTLCLTHNVKIEERFYNKAVVFHDGSLIHSQEKHKLFTIGEEMRHYTPGKAEDIAVFDAGGIKMAVLVCFELRFKELWKRCEGADVVLIPAMWGKLRKSHLEILSRALAVMNQCFVVVADSANSDMAKSSAVITPFGEVFADDEAKIVSKVCDLNEVKKIRRYLKVYE